MRLRLIAWLAAVCLPAAHAAPSAPLYLEWAACGHVVAIHAETTDRMWIGTPADAAASPEAMAFLLQAFQQAERVNRAGGLDLTPALATAGIVCPREA